MALRSPLNIISLCTGGGGLDLGVELAIPDARPVVLVEREAFSVAHLVSAMESGCMAQAPVWSDVRTFNGRPWRGLVDGVIGGIPCQPWSVAGKQLGHDDERDLWSDARRIIIQSGAWWCLIENVQGMLSAGGAERVWRDLRRLGFAVEVGLFTSAEVGAPHERMRVFFLAVANSDRRFPQRRGAICGQTDGRRTHDQSARSGEDVADAGRICGERRGESREFFGAQGSPDEKKRERFWRASCGGGATVGHADRAGLERRSRRELRECAGERPARPTGGNVFNAISCGHDGIEEDTIRRQIKRNAPERSERDDLPIYPPGPSNTDRWRAVIERAPQFEPAIRRMADGMAGRLDRLRMLGNGVNPLQAAYAVRTLATRLARRSAAADILVRMMEFET